MPCTLDDEVVTAGRALLHETDGVTLIYDVLDQAATRHHLSDAWLVLHSEPLGPQIFRRGRLPVGAERAAQLIARPPGVYGDPADPDPATGAALAGICEMALRPYSWSTAAARDPESGLSSRSVIDAALKRAAACAARYGWSSTAVLLTTAGDGEPLARWADLTSALHTALRVGDEAGVAGPRTAMAILGNAGPDAVRPFVARVRAALSAAGSGGTDLLVATASAPRDSLDPAELRRLAWERLGGVGAEPASSAADPSGAEIELRSLPGVVSVAYAPNSGDERLTVVALEVSEALRDEVRERVRRHFGHDDVELISVRPTGRSRDWAARVSPDGAPSHDTAGKGSGNGSGNGSGKASTQHADAGGGIPPLLSATAPGAPATEASGATARVTLLAATFDPDRGVSEVSLAVGAARGTGRAPAGPLAGGAQATLTALGALGFEVPFYLVSAERAPAVPGDPVIVVLSPRRDAATTAGVAERIGVAIGVHDVETASRATLGALNRYLTARPARS
jgi:hypothetical protein